MNLKKTLNILLAVLVLGGVSFALTQGIYLQGKAGVDPTKRGLNSDERQSMSSNSSVGSQNASRDDEKENLRDEGSRITKDEKESREERGSGLGNLNAEQQGSSLEESGRGSFPQTRNGGSSSSADQPTIDLAIGEITMDRGSNSDNYYVEICLENDDSSQSNWALYLSYNLEVDGSTSQSDDKKSATPDLDDLRDASDNCETTYITSARHNDITGATVTLDVEINPEDIGGDHLEEADQSNNSGSSDFDGPEEKLVDFYVDSSYEANGIRYDESTGQVSAKVCVEGSSPSSDSVLLSHVITKDGRIIDSDRQDTSLNGQSESCEELDLYNFQDENPATGDYEVSIRLLIAAGEDEDSSNNEGDRPVSYTQNDGSSSGSSNPKDTREQASDQANDSSDSGDSSDTSSSGIIACNALELDTTEYVMDADETDAGTQVITAKVTASSANWDGTLFVQTGSRSVGSLFYDDGAGGDYTDAEGTLEIGISGAINQVSIEYSDGQAGDKVFFFIEGEVAECRGIFSIYQEAASSSDTGDTNGTSDSGDTGDSSDSNDSSDSSDTSDSGSSSGDGGFSNDSSDSGDSSDSSDDSSSQTGYYLPEDCDYPWTDVSGHWVEDIACVGYEEDFINGKSSTELAPNDYVTRAEGVALFLRIGGLGDESPSTGTSFSDITSDEWFYDDLRVAEEYGVIKGSGTWNPNVYATRGDVAVWYARITGQSHYLTDDSELEFFSDLSTSDPSAYAFYLAYNDTLMLDGEQRRVIEGDDGEAQPYDYITRAEVFAIVLRTWISHYYAG